MESERLSISLCYIGTLEELSTSQTEKKAGRAIYIERVECAKNQR